MRSLSLALSARHTWRRTTLAAALGLSLLVLGPVTRAQRPWRFEHPDRPVKVVVLGGSATIYPRGNYGQFLGAACPNVEVKNLGKTGISIGAMKTRFQELVLDNPNVRPKRDEVWLLVRGGLNSLYDGHLVNRVLRDVFRAGHRAGAHVFALSLAPWGDAKDWPRWGGANALVTMRRMGLTVNFLLKRLAPVTALGRYAKRVRWLPGDLPDVAVDLWDSPLRDREAAPRDHGRTRRLLRRQKWVKRELARVPLDQRDETLEAMTDRAAAAPRWFLKRRYQAFDSTHPNTEGHRVIARLACQHAPASWGCNCALIDNLVWSPRAGTVVPKHRTARR